MSVFLAGCGQGNMTISSKDTTLQLQGEQWIKENSSQELIESELETKSEGSIELTTYCHDYLSFSYDAIKYVVDETVLGEDGSFLITVHEKDNNESIPRVDFLSVDISGLGDAFSADEYEAFAAELITAYYLNSLTPDLSYSFQNTQIKTGDEIRLSTEITVDPIDGVPEMKALIRLDGVHNNGVISIFVSENGSTAPDRFNEILSSLTILSQ